jgi:hypothetical protein
MIELDEGPGVRKPWRPARWAYPLVVVVFGVAWVGVRGEAVGEEFTAHVAIGDEVQVGAAEVRVRGIATVTNVDDEAAVVHALRADWPGVRIAANEERPHRMPPGGTAPMGVTITMSCAAGEPAGPVGRAVVNRADGRRGEVDVPITAARPWPAMRAGACEMLRNGTDG